LGVLISARGAPGWSADWSWVLREIHPPLLAGIPLPLARAGYGRDLAAAL